MHFRVMTWNVENLFPVGTRLSALGPPISRAHCSAKLKFLSTHINEQAPDVVALQEIGGAGADDESMLIALQHAVGTYPHRACGVPDERGIRVAFLSRWPLQDITHIVDFPSGLLSSVTQHPGQVPISRLMRGALSVQVTPPGSAPIRIITTHLKSKLLSYPGGRYSPLHELERAAAEHLALAQRTAEVMTLREHIHRLIAEGTSRVIVLGDLNDGPHATTSQLLLGPPDSDTNSSGLGDEARLFNLTDAAPLQRGSKHTLLPEGERFSRRDESKREMLDQILVSRDLVWKEGDCAVVRVRSLVHLLESENIRSASGERVGQEAPDHAPVWADFRL